MNPELANSVRRTHLHLLWVGVAGGCSIPNFLHTCEPRALSSELSPQPLLIFLYSTQDGFVYGHRYVVRYKVFDENKGTSG